MKINAYVKNRGPSVTSKPLPNTPSSLRRKRSSQPSSELSSSKECLVAEKGGGGGGGGGEKRESEGQKQGPYLLPSNLGQQCITMAYIA